MDIKLYSELIKVCEEMKDNKYDRLKEIEEDLINPNMPLAEKIHEVITCINDLYHVQENLCKLIKLQQNELLAKG